MIIKTIKITNPQGLHARPAALICQITSRFQSEIKISKDGYEANGKSVMGIMMLAAECDSELEVKIDGLDAENLWTELENLIKSNFNE